MLEGSAAFVAWLGASVTVLADGRRGLTVGAAIATLGIAALVLQGAGPLDAAILFVGGALAAARGAISGGEWVLMPPGSTPRLILCIAVGLVALWVAASITSGPGAALRFAVLAVLGLQAARVLSSDARTALATSAGLLALAAGAAAGLGGDSAPWPYLAAAIVAGGAAWLPERTPRAA